MRPAGNINFASLFPKQCTDNLSFAIDHTATAKLVAKCD